MSRDTSSKSKRQQEQEQGTVIRVHYDADKGRRITLRGSELPLSWSTGQEATWSQGHIWTYVWPETSGVLEFKPLLDDESWSVGGNYRVEAGSTVDIFPFFGAQDGTLHKEHDFHSPQLGNRRSLIISLPASYSENPLKRYPVLYMHDGQNVFEDSTSFTGVAWRVDQTSRALAAQGLMDELIVVGVANTGSSRAYEYTPGPASDRGGGADLYGRFLVDTVKPWVDARYRTLTGPEDTALMGSSLGGLISFYLGMRHPEAFSKVACLSSAFGWNGLDLVNEVRTTREQLPAKCYLDAGTNRDPITPTRRMRQALEERGYVHGKNLFYFEDEGGRHTEASWAARVHLPLQFLFPWQSASTPR
ncbi:MAG: alpha/beta hydrolase [Hyalangium sp.]|uniref:alpha/beta hydrolase n=1 Tax=Hyalangium sp. TaxID=2028555 RepID=UPI003899BCAE